MRSRSNLSSPGRAAYQPALVLVFVLNELAWSPMPFWTSTDRMASQLSPSESSSQGVQHFFFNSLGIHDIKTKKMSSYFIGRIFCWWARGLLLSFPNDGAVFLYQLLSLFQAHINSWRDCQKTTFNLFASQINEIEGPYSNNRLTPGCSMKIKWKVILRMYTRGYNRCVAGWSEWVRSHRFELPESGLFSAVVCGPFLPSAMLLLASISWDFSWYLWESALELWEVSWSGMKRHYLGLENGQNGGALSLGFAFLFGGSSITHPLTACKDYHLGGTSETVAVWWALRGDSLKSVSFPFQPQVWSLFFLPKVNMASISQHSIDALPYSCTWRILEFLDVIGLREMRTVSRRFKLFADGDRVWQIHAAPFLKKANASQAAPTHGFRSIFYQNRTSRYLQTHHDWIPGFVRWSCFSPLFPLLPANCLVSWTLWSIKVKLWAINTMSDGMTFENHVLKSEPSLTNWGTAVVNYPRIRTRKQYCEVCRAIFTLYWGGSALRGAVCCAWLFPFLLDFKRISNFWG